MDLNIRSFISYQRLIQFLRTSKFFEDTSIGYTNRMGTIKFTAVNLSSSLYRKTLF